LEGIQQRRKNRRDARNWNVADRIVPAVELEPGISVGPKKYQRGAECTQY
jgi:hypothetical protein